MTPLLTVLSLIKFSLSLVRSSQARIFPLDSDPPEETLELWMGRQSLPVPNPDDDDTDGDPSTSGLDCTALAARQAVGGGHRLGILMAALNCLRCQRRQATMSDAEATPADCGALLCRNRKCKRPKGNAPFDDVEMNPSPQSPHIAAKRSSPSHYPTLADNEKEDMSKEELYSEYEKGDLDVKGWSPSQVKARRRRPSLKLDLTGLRRGEWGGPGRRVKRYRLGLYDCITSYCGKLEGPDRQGCIVNSCHRSSTLKM